MIGLSAIIGIGPYVLVSGLPLYEMLCQANGNLGDTSGKGRQMPAHWGNKKLNIFNKSSCTGTQFVQACGLAEAGEYLAELRDAGIDISEHPFKDDEVVFCSTGDGTTSQGEFWEGLTTASVNNFLLFLRLRTTVMPFLLPRRFKRRRINFQNIGTFPGTFCLGNGW